MHFASNDGSQNTLVYQPTLGALQLKKDKGTYYVSIGNRKDYIILTLSHYILLSWIP